MTTHPAYGRTHAYRIGKLVTDTLAAAIRYCADNGLNLLDIRFVEHDWNTN